MKMDLHSHTKYSDGELDVLGNVQKAKELNLDGIAITDHDNIDSWEDIDNIDFDINVIKGVELSTYYNGENIHILGYYLNNGGNYKELSEFLSNLRKLRKERVEKMISLLKEHYNIEITYENVVKFADGAIGRPHVALAIMEKYPERNYTMDDIFDNFIHSSKKAYVKTSNFQTEDAIELLRRNNCLVVLAHPLLIKKQSFKDVLELGFDGVEVFYPYEEGDYSEVYEYVKNKNYILTGGSDYHGPNIRNTIGKAYNYDNYLDEFLKRINFTPKKNTRML